MKKIKNITLTRNGQTEPLEREVSTMHADGLTVGQEVMLRIKGDSCYGKPSEYRKYVVADIKKSDRFDGKCSDVTFTRAGAAAPAPVVPEVMAAAPAAEDEPGVLRLTVDATRAQYAVVCRATGEMLRETVKFGAMLIEWERFLGEAVGGRGTTGEGLKGWLAKNCPEVNYKTAMAAKALATKQARMLGGGASAIAALQGRTMVQLPTAEVIQIDGDLIERREAIFEQADSRRKLEQLYLDFMREAGQGGAGRPKGARAGGGERLSAMESARRLWAGPVALFAKKRSAFFAAARLLPKEEAAKAAGELGMMVAELKARVNEAD